MPSTPTGESARANGAGLGDLLRDLAHGGSRLARQEVRLAQLETVEVTRTVGVATAWVGLGGVIAILGVLAASTGVILLGGDQWLRDRFWLAALIVAVVAGAAALWLAARGRSHLTLENLVPDQTVDTLKEDQAWLKRQVTSGATSSSPARA